MWKLVQARLKMLVFGALWSIATVTPLATVHSQRPPVELGHRVRVTAPSVADRHLVGTVERWTGDSLALSAQDATVLAVPLASITRLEVSRSKRSHTAVGAVLGFIGFAGLGYVIGSNIDCGSDCPPAQGGAIAAGIVSIPGVLIGAVIGSSMKVDRWEEVPLERFRVSVTPHGDGRFACGASITF